MSTREVTWFKDSKLAEIYQSFDMKFAFANISNEKIIQCHQWVKCRDFLHDVIRTMLTDKDSSIWGFKFKKNTNPDITMDSINFLISNKQMGSKDLSIVLDRSLKLINYFENLVREDFSKIRRVQADDVNGYKYVWLISGPKFWLTTPYLISLYTFLIRLGKKDIKFNNTKTLHKEFNRIIKTEKADNDIKYLKNVWDKLELIITNNKKLNEFNKAGFSDMYFENTNITEFHNRSGIVSTCTANTWYDKLNEQICKIKEEKKK